MRTKRRVGIIGLTILILLLVSAFAVAQPEQNSEATLVVAEGRATVSQQGSVPLVMRDSSVSLSAGQALTVRAGDKISLDPGAVGQLRLFDGSTVDLTEGASLEVTELNTTDSTYRVQLNLLAGRTLSRVVRALGIGDAFEIRTPSSTASVRGTVFTVAVISPDSTYFSCDEGVVHIVLQDQSVDIHPNEEVTAIIGRPLQVQTKSGAAPTAVPTATPTPTAMATAVPSTPTATPTIAPKSGKSAQKTTLESIVAGLFDEEPLINKEEIINPPSSGDGTTPDKIQPENTPHAPSQVPGNTPADTPGNGNPPDSGGIPPGQGGIPPGQENNPSNGNGNGNSGNNGNGNGGGKKN